MCLNRDGQGILSYWEGWAIALASEGAARPLSGQFTNWLLDGILGVGDSGIASSGNVVNRNVFSTYGIAFEKPGLIQKFDISEGRLIDPSQISEFKARLEVMYLIKYDLRKAYM